MTMSTICGRKGFKMDERKERHIQMPITTTTTTTTT
jgi:hypothetical protein